MPRPDAVRALLALALTGILAACGEATPSASSSSPTATEATAPPGTHPPTPVLATPTAAASATVAPTPATIALGGEWLHPKAGARLMTYTVTLSARPTASGPGLTALTRVVFAATWAGAERTVVCRATKPDRNGAWSCRANLLARGVPPGAVTFTFDVRAEGVTTARSPDGSRKVTYAVPPPRPTGVRWEQLTKPDFEHGDGTALHRVRWSAPAGYADEFVVYETFECPRPSNRRNADKPCFGAGTPVDLSQLEPRATASGDARSVKLRLDEYECGPSAGSILLLARNSYGSSGFVIVDSASVIWVPPNVMVC
jgi:hypothetical protein